MTKIIKKYKNRRLYDTSISRYITLEELQTYVLANEAFQVVDSINGEDLTQATLLQLLLEMQPSSRHFLSQPLLRQLIIFANHPLQKNLQSYLEQFFNQTSAFIEKNTTSFDYFQQEAKKWSQQMQDTLENWKNFLKK